MHATLRVKTRVLPGKRIEFTAPELTEGELVEVAVDSALPGPPPDESPEERARRFREWADSHGDFPELAPEAFEREHFYGDRG
jgi:hypothetical protein